ncbi:MAG: EAL domain-containing protein [Bryobacterales bacterium]|nr:EAL domain-containing protein [Bryobacterales bacterium]
MGLLIDVLSSQLSLGGQDLAHADSLSSSPCRELVDNVSEIVYVCDLEGHLVSANRAVEPVTGYSRDEILGMRLRDLLTPDSADVALRMTASTLGSGSRSNFEVSLLRRDGRPVRLEMTSRLLFQNGRPCGVIAVGHPAGRRPLTESDLRLLKSVVVNANDAVLIAEAKTGDHLGGKIVYVNEAFCRMTGYTAEEAVGRTPRILLGPQTDRDQLNQVRQALGNWESLRVELINYRKNGSAYWVDVNFVPITEESGEFTHWVAVQRETTQRKQAESLERDRNRVLELVARNEPLDSVLGVLAQMVERQCPDLRCSILLLRDGEMEQVAGAKLTGDALREVQQPASDLLSATGPRDRYREILPGPHLGAHWSVPILSGSGKVLGAFAVSCGLTRKPEEAEMETIGKAGRLAAIAIEQRQLTERLAHQAQHDALTGLPNRALFEERLHQALAQAKAQGWHLAVLFIDLDRFKQINDTLGHDTGDALLQQVAQKLELRLRKTDTLARMGGDEFTVLLTELRDPQYALKVAQKLLDCVREPFHAGGYELFVTASIGVSAYPQDGRDAATLQRNADGAMYRAKSLGRNNVQAFLPEIGVMALESLELENALRKAIEHDEFQLRYQQQTDLAGKLVGLEALLVWNHPKLGVIPPRQFIPVAEESGLIVPIGNWVLREACRQRAQWQGGGRSQVTVAVNVSAVQFTRKGFVETVAEALRDAGLDPALLELELTESVIMRDVHESARQMERLRSLGVSLAIDDFGTGYSSLSYLRILPIDTLKIDRSFLREVDSDPNTMPLVKAIVALAHSLHLRVVAEGVETQRQLDALRTVACDRVQGFLIGEPVGAEAATELYRASTSAASSAVRSSGGAARQARASFATS